MKRPASGKGRRIAIESVVDERGVHAVFLRDPEGEDRPELGRTGELVHELVHEVIAE